MTEGFSNSFKEGNFSKMPRFMRKMRKINAPNPIKKILQNMRTDLVIARKEN